MASAATPTQTDASSLFVDDADAMTVTSSSFVPIALPLSTDPVIGVPVASVWPCRVTNT